MKKIIKLFGTNVILRGEMEKSSLLLAEETQKTRKLKGLTVFLVGDKVENLELGDKVMVKPELLLTGGSKGINPFDYTGKDYKTEDEFYILVEEEDIIGKF